MEQLRLYAIDRDERPCAGTFAHLVLTLQPAEMDTEGYGSATWGSLLFTLVKMLVHDAEVAADANLEHDAATVSERFGRLAGYLRTAAAVAERVEHITGLAALGQEGGP
jgi:hypothetical protein